jgi:hypothetical protein
VADRLPRLRAADRWLLGYWRARRQRPRQVRGPLHLIVAVCDHYEPLAGRRRPLAEGREHVARWVRDLPARTAGVAGADGQTPRHTIFYPGDEYEPELVSALSPLAESGLVELEIHLHHDGDTAATLRQQLISIRDVLRQDHGALGSVGSAPGYAFIHGNWALCNGRPDGRHCGVNDELKVLRDTGCYVDMTMPSGPSPTQTPLVNSVYYAASRETAPRGHDAGEPVVRRGSADEPEAMPPPAGMDLLLVQGPLAPNWASRKWGVLPRLEYGDLSHHCPPTPARADLWVRQHIHVGGRPDWVFVKLHTHGCAAGNADVLLGESMAALHRHLTSRYNDGDSWRLYYASARELYNMVKAAEAGAPGPPSDYRDFAVTPPPIRQRRRPEQA